MTVALKYALNRCCCDADEPLAACPCLAETLPLTKSLTVTGITMEPVRLNPGNDYPDINDSYDMDQINLPARNFYCGNQGVGDQLPLPAPYTSWSIRARAHIGFTRATRVSFGDLVTSVGTLALGTWDIDPGVKALISFEAEIRPSFFTVLDASWALFWKVIDDEAADSVNCDLDLNGFTFEAQRHTQPATGFPDLLPVFDASAASFSYS